MNVGKDSIHRHKKFQLLKNLASVKKIVIDGKE